MTNHVPPDRVGAFRALAERVPLDLVAFGGRTRHATTGQSDDARAAGSSPAEEGTGGADTTARRLAEREVFRLAAGGGHSAVICGTAGRIALPAAYAGARRAGVPFVLWASLWAHPLTPAHVLGYAPMLAIYRNADAVVTYGEHVSDYVARRGARRTFVAPQAVDNEWWAARPDGAPPAGPGLTALFAGRPAREKGLHVLEAAWAQVGDGTLLRALGDVSPQELRNFYAAADVLVVPSLRTRDFREPWGLVVNEAMNQRTAIIASDQVGAAAGGLVRHQRNGLIVPAGDPAALAAAIARLRDDHELRRTLADNGARDVAAFTYSAWAAGFEAALREVGAC